jgi:hypothetical protein
MYGLRTNVKLSNAPRFGVSRSIANMEPADSMLFLAELAVTDISARSRG